MPETLAPNSQEPAAESRVSTDTPKHIGVSLLSSLDVTHEFSLEPELMPLEGVSQESLTPEMEQKIQNRIAEKNQDRSAQVAEVAEVTEGLSSGVESRWINNGEVVSRPLVEDDAALEKQIQEAVTTYQETEAGQKDLRIKEFRAYLSNPDPTREELAIMAEKVKHKISPSRIKISRRHADKVEDSLRQRVEDELLKLEDPRRQPSDEASDWKTRQERETAGYDVHEAVSTTSVRYLHTLDGFKHRQEHPDKTKDTPLQKIDKLKAEIDSLDITHDRAASELVSQLTNSPALMSLITRGSLSPAELVQLTKEYDKQIRVDVRSVFTDYIAEQWDKNIYRLAEPSIAGMRISERDLEAERSCLETLSSLAKTCGVETPSSVDQAAEQIQQDVQRAQELFYSKIDTPNSLYWHFTSKGQAIISSGAIKSGGGGNGRHTGEWSKGVHFVKPGLGIETENAYHGFTQGEVRRNLHPDQPEELGMAIILPLGSILTSTPIRDEPITDVYAGRGNVSDDVTFRESDMDHDYEYSIDDAYILPMVSRAQLSKLRQDSRYADLFEAGKPVEQLAYEVTRQAFTIAGRSDEWISEHLLPAGDLVDRHYTTESDDKERERELFASVSGEIHKRQAEDIKLVVPLTAKRGSVEIHDGVKGHSAELWTEELVVLSAA